MCTTEIAYCRPCNITFTTTYCPEGLRAQGALVVVQGIYRGPTARVENGPQGQNLILGGMYRVELEARAMHEMPDIFRQSSLSSRGYTNRSHPFRARLGH
jgi:hypothetical protein